MQLKPSKCHLFQKELLYLGHLVSANGIRLDPKKIQAISYKPAPKKVTAVRSFIGTCGFFLNYVSNFSEICGPLYALTREGIKFKWQEKKQQAFENLKQAMFSAPIFQHPNFNFPFIIETDASDKGLGAILIQRLNNQTSIIQYVSRNLQPSERK